MEPALRGLTLYAAVLWLTCTSCTPPRASCPCPAWGPETGKATTRQAGPASEDHPDDPEEGFVPLFDGRSLAGWQGRTEEYEAADGLLVCKKGAHGSLYTDRQYSDFILRLEYRLEPGGNNGIGIRAPLGDAPPAATGMEIQILDDDFPGYRDFQPVQFNGSIYGAGPAERGHARPAGEWNAMEITACGPHIQVMLNGKRILQADMDDVGPVRMHGFDFVGLHNRTGRIAICGHEHRVEFRRIRIKELEPSRPSAGS